jgi:hypothetical protein
LNFFFQIYNMDEIERLISMSNPVVGVAQMLLTLQMQRSNVREVPFQPQAPAATFAQGGQGPFGVGGIRHMPPAPMAPTQRTPLQFGETEAVRQTTENSPPDAIQHVVPDDGTMIGITDQVSPIFPQFLLTGLFVYA